MAVMPERDNKMPESSAGMEFHLYRDKLGYWRWFLCTASGRRLADSGEFFTRREDCLAAIELVRNLGESTINIQ